MDRIHWRDHCDSGELVLDNRYWIKKNLRVIGGFFLEFPPLLGEG